MATRKKKTAKKAKKTTTRSDKNADGPESPEGFKSVRSGTSDGYFRVEEGAWIQGVIMGRYFKQSGNFPGFYYQLRLTKPCGFVQKKDEDGEYYDTEAEEGEIISADERSIMTGLQPFAEEAPDKLYEVWIHFEEKQKNGGRTFWKGDAKVMPYHQPDQGPDNEAGALGGVDDEVPF